MIAYPFLRYRWPNLVLGVVLIGLGKYLQSQTFDLPWLVWLGFEPANHVYLDYFPLIKWFGVVLLGIFAGNLLYPENHPSNPPARSIAALARASAPPIGTSLPGDLPDPPAPPVRNSCPDAPGLGCESRYLLNSCSGENQEFRTSNFASKLQVSTEHEFSYRKRRSQSGVMRIK